MKDYTVVNEVKTLERVCVCIWSTCVCVLCCVKEGGLFARRLR